MNELSPLTLAAEFEKSNAEQRQLLKSRAAIEAHEARKVPDGWQLVPKEPTFEMAKSLFDYPEDGDEIPWPKSMSPNFALAAYRIMLASVPTAWTPEQPPLLASAPPAPQAVPPELDVRKIMLSVEPGWDGMGVEVYAKSVADVEAALGKMGEELGDWQLGIKRYQAPQASVVQEPVAWLVCSVNKDGSLSLEHAAPWQEAAHAHIDDAITEHGIEEAASWVVRPVYTHPAPVREPLTDRIDHLERVLVQAREWVAERPEDRPISAGKLVAAIDEALESESNHHPAG